MQHLSDSLPTRARWELAVQAIPPASLAQSFASHVGQFFDRQEFDALARQVSDLYDQSTPERAERFRERLDRRLYDGYHAPVTWDLVPSSSAA
jgi:hypothetical protein